MSRSAKMKRASSYVENLAGAKPRSPIKPVIIPEFVDLDALAIAGGLKLQRHDPAGRKGGESSLRANSSKRERRRELGERERADRRREGIGRMSDRRRSVAGLSTVVGEKKKKEEKKNSGFGGGCRGGGDIGRRVYKKKLRKKGKVGDDELSQGSLC